MSVFQWFPKLEELLIGDAEWLDSDTLFRPYSFLAGCYEGLMDRLAVGASSQRVKGHDHKNFTDGGLGGGAVARNTIYSAGNGNNLLYQCDITLPQVGIFQKIDKDSGAIRSTAGFGTFSCFVSPSFSSAGSPPVSSPYLDAYVYLHWEDPGFNTVDIRIHNRGLGFNSEVTSVFAAGVVGAWRRVTKIPCIGDGLNGFDIEIKSDAPLSINCNGFVLSESTIVDTETVAVGASLGSLSLGG